MKDLNKSFDKKFPEYYGGIQGRADSIKHFIKEREKEFIEKVAEEFEKMICSVKNHPEHCHYPIALTDALNKLEELSYNDSR